MLNCGNIFISKLKQFFTQSIKLTDLLTWNRRDGDLCKYWKLMIFGPKKRWYFIYVSVGPGGAAGAGLGDLRVTTGIITFILSDISTQSHKCEIPSITGKTWDKYLFLGSNLSIIGAFKAAFVFIIRHFQVSTADFISAEVDAARDAYQDK